MYKLNFTVLHYIEVTVYSIKSQVLQFTKFKNMYCVIFVNSLRAL